MREELQKILRSFDADYIEVRLEEAEAFRLRRRGGKVEEIGTVLSGGGNVRALKRGSWGFVTFDFSPAARSEEEILSLLREKIALAVKAAELGPESDVKLAPAEPVVDVVEAEPPKDPFQVPLERKKEIFEEYDDIILSTSGIKTSSIAYSEARRIVTFANSEGSYIKQSFCDLTLRITATARKGNEVQQASLSLGSAGDFGAAEGLQEKVRETAERAVALLDAPTLRGGEYTVILDPVLGGVFAHEAFGHLSEADFVYENEKLREIMVLGRRFGEKILNIIDNPALPGLRGSYKYDDEGVPASGNYLIKEGVLVGRLHSRETAAKMGESPTGNARAINHLHPPIVRMSNTYIEPGEASFEDLISEVKEGVYVRNWRGGTTSMEMFTFSAGEAFMIRNGRVEELLRPVVLTGNVFFTLREIDAVGNDLQMNQGGGCGKGGQFPLPVSDGSPHIRIRRCLIGGEGS